MKNHKSVLAIITTGVIGLSVVASASPRFGPSDVQRGEVLVKSGDYKAAAGLLSEILKDEEFTAIYPTDTARAGMLLLDSCVANGDQQSQIYKTSRDVTENTLIAIWARLRHKGVSGNDRINQIAQICSGHPDIMADVLRLVLPRLIESNNVTDSDVISYLDAANNAYKQVRSTVPNDKVTVDLDLLIEIADYYFHHRQFESATNAYDEVLTNATDAQQDIKGTALMYKAAICYYTKDYDRSIDCCKQCIAMPLSVDAKLNVTNQLAVSLESVGRVDEAVAVLETIITDGYPAVQTSAILQVGRIYANANNNEHAIKVYKRMKDVTGATDDSKANAVYEIARCYWKLGNKHEAYSNIYEVVKLYPNSDWANLARTTLRSWGEGG